MHHLHQGTHHLRIVGDAFDHGDAASQMGLAALHDQARHVHQQTRPRCLFQVVVSGLTQGACQRHQLLGQWRGDAGFSHHNLLLQRRIWKVKGQRHKALPRTGLQGFHQMLVAGVVGDHQHEFGWRFQHHTEAVDRQDAPVIGE